MQPSPKENNHTYWNTTRVIREISWVLKHAYVTIHVRQHGIKSRNRNNVTDKNIQTDTNNKQQTHNKQQQKDSEWCI
jgi:hypothetical protein